MSKIDTDPSTLTEEEAEYLKEMFPTLPKDPKKMTTQEWYDFWDELWGPATGPADNSEYDNLQPNDYGEYGGDCDADCVPSDCGECYNGWVLVDCGDLSDTSHMDPNWTCDC